jgi:hypothetical protein
MEGAIVFHAGLGGEASRERGVCAGLRFGVRQPRVEDALEVRTRRDRHAVQSGIAKR